MSDYLAHSARDGCPAQPYAEHVREVCSKATRYADKAEFYAAKSSGVLTSVVPKSALLHDLGKLDSENQSVLRSSNSPRHLPINHVDAGSAALKADEDFYSALMVYSHHRGLPDMGAECLREESIFRDEFPAVRNHVDSTLDGLLRCHYAIFSSQLHGDIRRYDGDLSVFCRMALSCLADADHTDTAIAYHQAPEHENLPQLHAKDRLAALDRYVSELGEGDERSQLRREMYFACRNAAISGNFSACDSPVGSGKTTAVMAHLLQQAITRNARHIFVVLPYTSIIKQSVDVYRRALLLPGENPEEVVAELHSRADFQDHDTRYLTSLWRAPIIVTTAVAFFETLASSRPSTLRRFHEIPGSVIFLDEAHNALPLKLLPLAWRWMNVLSEEWSCYWVLASGSLVRFWELDRLSEINMSHPTVCELVNVDLRRRLMQYERDRIIFRWRQQAVGRHELIDWIQSVPGPRLLILNTVQSAAVVADDLCRRFGRKHVEHLSTALTPEDRCETIERIKSRLNVKDDTDWTLVATSCVEAGVDFSFRTGFREMSSLLSLLQASGRVNRHGEYSPYAEMWSFTLQDDSLLKKNRQTDTSKDVLCTYFMKNLEISPSLSSQSLNDEVIRDDSCLKTIKDFIKDEDEMQFQTINSKFKVIESNTLPAIVDTSLAEEIACGRGDWSLLQKKSVSIWQNNKRKWQLREIANGVFQWTLGYDSFLGYMRGVLDVERPLIL